MPSTASPPPSGALPPWDVGALPAPPPFTIGNALKVIGPGAILLATSIGGGEWLVGPATGVKYGASLMWIATVAIVFQLVFNLEAIRYTLYTGEPIYTGIMRLKPGSAFWSVVYGLLALVQLGWPALVLSTAGVVFSMSTGRLPGTAATDAVTMHWIGAVIIAGVAAILLFGGTIERMLEQASWFMLIFIFSFLVIVNVLFVPLTQWLETLRGFVLIRGSAAELDWGLLGALAGTAGCGGLGNLTITNWIRDKGFGMGSQVGAIESAVGGRKTRLSPIGKVFPVTAESLQAWRLWWRYIHADQIWVWALFCFLGLFLNVNLAMGLIPAGSEMQGLATGAYQARYLADHLWSGFWVLTLLNGFWILFSTNLGNTDILTRTLTDLSWTGSPAIRRWAKDHPGRIYYTTLLVFSLWSMLSVRLAGPFVLFKIMANIAGFILAVAGVQILIVNRTFLPRELRPPLWRELLLGGTVLFYAFFTVRAIVSAF